MFSVEFVPGAARQIARVRDWWFTHRDKAPFAFDDDLDELIGLLEHAPRAIGVAVAQRAGVRRALMKRVRYYVYFTITDEIVTIVAVWHTSRGAPPAL